MPYQNFGMVKWLIICLSATQRAIHVTLIEAVSPTRLAAAVQVSAGLWHLISMACQLKANVPTCPPLYVAPLHILTGLSYCLLAEPKATGHLHLRGGAGECLCGQSQWRVSERTLCGGREREKESRSESSPVYLPVNR